MEIGFGPLGTSCSSAPNSLPAISSFDERCEFWVFRGCKFVVDAAAGFNDFEGSEEAIVGGFRRWDKLMRRRRKKRRVMIWRQESDFVKVFESSGDCLGAAMQSERRNHPPKSPQGFNIHQPAQRRRERERERFQQK